MQVKIDVQPDHLEREAATKPSVGLAELIWNAVDADANNIIVTYDRNELDGIEGFTVTDDGHGIDHAEAREFFGKLGGSWKKDKRESKTQRRVLHGQEGRGRFKAFALGNTVAWHSTFEKSGQFHSFWIVGTRPALNQFEISDLKSSASGPAGTAVEISEMREGVDSLNDSKKVASELSRRLALYLRKYPSVSIQIEGEKVDPASVESHVAEYTLEDVTLRDGRKASLRLGIIEWKVPTERALYLCDKKGFAKHEIPPAIKAPGWNFTAYVGGDVIEELEERGAFALGELDSDLATVIEAAKKQMKAHFRKRTAEVATSVVENWKKDGVYPYAGDPKGKLEETERQVFDVVALQLSEALPDFEGSDVKSKKLSMLLLRRAIENSPEDVQLIFQEVLELPSEKQADLVALLRRTSLSAVISSAKLLADRLDILRGLEMLLFNSLSEQQLEERYQLHKILENYTWLWGEEFALSVSDRSLNDVLDAHVQLLGKREDDDTAVRREDGRKGIVDLMLSRAIPNARAWEREHLVVELKRPSVKIGLEELAQVQSYANAVADDARFKDVKTRWIFWVISNEMKESARKQARQQGRPPGLVYQSDGGQVEVWAKTWGEVLQLNRARLQFFQEKLEYRVDDQSALDLLHKLHAKYLPPVFAPPPVAEE